MDTVYKTACKFREALQNNENINTPEFQNLKDTYPKLYSMLQNPKMDIQMFEKLFQIIQSDSSENGASKFSTFGAEKYLYPQFGRPSASDMENAKQKLAKRI